MKPNTVLSTFVTSIVIIIGCTAWAWTKAPAAAAAREPSTRAIVADAPVNPDIPFTFVDGRDSNPPALDASNQSTRFAGKEDAEPTAVAKARLAREAVSTNKPYPTPNPKKSILAHYRPMPSEPEKVAIIWFND